MRRLPFVLVNLCGVVAFVWPFLAAQISPTHQRTTVAETPWLMAAIVPLLIAVAISEARQGGLDSKSIALLGMLAAITAVMRLPISFAGANLIFFLPMVAGVVFGSSFGFMLGAIGMGASALITGGIGPWLPFQMFAVGWVGMGAGCLDSLIQRVERPWMKRGILAIYGAIAAIGFGFIINLYFWPVVTSGSAPMSWTPGLGVAQTFQHYMAFYLFTSFGWDFIGAIANVTVMATLGLPAMTLLARSKMRLSAVIESGHRDSYLYSSSHP